jgi:hypothetical protein
MVAYQAETDLVRRIAPYFTTPTTKRALVQSMLANAGDIAVAATELRITFAPADLASRRRPRFRRRAAR